MSGKKYYPEFFDPANMVAPYLDPPKGTLWDGFINDGDTDIDSDFADFLWLRLQDACNDIDDVYDEAENGDITKKSYDEMRKIFEHYFEELETLTDSMVIHTSPLDLDVLTYELLPEKKISMWFCYGMYCIDRGLRAYFLNHTEISSKAISYGVSAIQRAMEYQLMTIAETYSLINNSSKAGKAKAARYKPLKDLARDLVTNGSYKSRRNAAISIAPKILEKGLNLNPKVVLSEEQSVQTITGWLKDMGLPANI